MQLKEVQLQLAGELDDQANSSLLGLSMPRVSLGLSWPRYLCGNNCEAERRLLEAPVNGANDRLERRKTAYASRLKGYQPLSTALYLCRVRTCDEVLGPAVRSAPEDFSIG